MAGLEDKIYPGRGIHFPEKEVTREPQITEKPHKNKFLV